MTGKINDAYNARGQTSTGSGFAGLGSLVGAAIDTGDRISLVIGFACSWFLVAGDGASSYGR